MNTTGKPGHRGGANRRGSKAIAGKPHAADGRPKASAAPERIAKRLARAGIASRRDAERMIEDGRVSVNGRVLATPAVNVTVADRIEVDGVQLRGIERTRLWLYHKPAGLVTTHRDPQGRPTVFERLPSDLPRVLSVGRLDINTEGLLLLTNDGGLARVLELPTTGWLRRYRVRAHGKTDQPALDRLQDGIAVDGVLYGAIEATLDRVQGSNVWITMGFREGKNREIKNVLGALGLEVNRLIRVSYGPFQLSDLAEGELREVRGRTLREQLGPRLIDESGADFDAPLFDEDRVSDRSRDGKKKSPGPKAQKKPRRTDRTGRPDADDRRQRPSGRLDREAREERPRKPQRRNRASNVWMAPGARPSAAKSASADGGERPAPGKGKAAKPSRKSQTGDKRQSRRDRSGRGGNADRRR